MTVDLPYQAELDLTLPAQPCHRDPDVDAFVDSLADYNADAVFNPWNDVSDTRYTDLSGPLDRRERLIAHLNCPDPKLILAGEAPGYNGCHWTGIPFTSERLVIGGSILRVPPTTRLTTRNRPFSEPSATIMWGLLHELGVAEHTILWNAFPWHPHEPGNELSNRTPGRDEVHYGAQWLHTLRRIYPETLLIVVGRVAERSCNEAGISFDGGVQHPAYGGANKFRDGIRRLGVA